MLALKVNYSQDNVNEMLIFIGIYIDSGHKII